MIREALEYLVDLARPEIIYPAVNDYSYCNKKLEIIQDPLIQPLQINTLTGLLDYCDTIDKQMILHIVDEANINCLNNKLDKWNRRTLYAKVRPIAGKSHIDHCYIDIEAFIIQLQTNFVRNESICELIKTLGNVTDNQVAEFADNGVSQAVTVRSGINFKTKAELPVILALAPYRTFEELEQPESLYLFRAKEGEKSIKCALFPSLSDRWKIDAIKSIKRWLIENTKENGKEKYIIVA